jgi:tripartite-type tricarboxylate transporter receptor subunit TctC
MNKIMSDPDVKAKTANIGLIPIDSPSISGINDYIKAERMKWGTLVRQLGLEGSQ